MNEQHEFDNKCYCDSCETYAQRQQRKIDADTRRNEIEASFGVPMQGGHQ